jgi:hypothetical protein
MPAEARALEEGWTTAVGALRAFAVAPDWLAAVGDPAPVAKALTCRVPELARGELTLKTCEVTQVRTTQNALLALYRVELAAGHRRPSRAVDLRGELVPPGLPEPDAATDGATLGSSAWRCWVPELRLHLTTEATDDPRLPSLPSLMNAEVARAHLERAIRASPGRADLRIEACSPRLARHKRGSHCTIVYRLQYPVAARAEGWPDAVVAKTYHDGRGRDAYDGMRALWNSRLRDSRNVTIAEPLAFLPELNALVQARIPHQRSLNELLRSSLGARTPEALDDLAAYMAKTAAGLADLHACGARPAEVVEAVNWDDELAEIRARLAQLGALIPDVAVAATPLLTRLETLARQHPADPLRPAHRSFRPTQVLLHDGSIGFVDFDGICRAEPAIDVALFRAVVKDVGLRALQAKEGKTPDGQPRPEHLAQLDELCEGFLARYEEAAPISRRRVALWEALDLFTLVLSSWTKVKFDRLPHRLALLRRHLRVSELDG